VIKQTANLVDIFKRVLRRQTLPRLQLKPMHANMGLELETYSWAWAFHSLTETLLAIDRTGHVKQPRTAAGHHWICPSSRENPYHLFMQQLDEAA